MSNLRVSVVIAAFNSENYIKMALDSVIAQTLKEIEIICVDDGSSDGTYGIMRDYQTKDSRIRVLRHTEQTDGAAGARNMGLCEAKGEYLCFLDADDYFEAEMLEIAYKRAKETCADIVLFDGWVFDEHTRIDKEADFILRKKYLPKNMYSFTPEENADQLFLMTCGAAWNGIYRQRFVEGKGLRFQSFHHADDLGFVYLAFALASRISVVEERFIHYRKNTGTSQADLVYQWPKTCYLALGQLKQALDEKGVFEAFHIAFAQIVLVYSIFYLDAMRNWADFKELYEALCSKWFKDLGVNDVPIERFSNDYWTGVRDIMNELSPEEYIFRKLRGISPFENKQVSNLRIPIGSTIAIYGAGKRGRSLFWELMNNDDYYLKAWVDKNYEILGYPVQPLKRLEEVDVDCVIIAITSNSIYNEVKTYLMKKGIEDNKIHWIGEKHE